MSMFMSVSISMYASVCIYIIYISLLYEYIGEVHSILYIYLYLQPAYLYHSISIPRSADVSKAFFHNRNPIPKVLHPTRWVYFILGGRDY